MCTYLDCLRSCLEMLNLSDRTVYSMTYVDTNGFFKPQVSWQATRYRSQADVALDCFAVLAKTAENNGHLQFQPPSWRGPMSRGHPDAFR
ncbi:hypothetical protein SAMN05421881_103711 [Nitrosomonas halophila]|uniref:Uncharacterized protein n=1 Tax=Nitrosomonas halophila TaxID=44576 RepID=A0A1H3K1X9_9PROT|nr:hypothetical protein SAMN05421881_103711 [Nitrosomonas halophila]